MSEIDVLSILERVECTTGSIEFSSDCPVLILEHDGWSRHEAGKQSVTMLPFEGPGGAAAGEALLAKVTIDAIRSGYGGQTPDGKVGMLFARQAAYVAGDSGSSSGCHRERSSP